MANKSYLEEKYCLFLTNLPIPSIHCFCRHHQGKQAGGAKAHLFGWLVYFWQPCCRANKTSNVTKPPMNVQRTLVTLVTTLAFLTLPLLSSAQNKGTNKRSRVEIKTELGTMVVELYNETPQHRDNFLKLVQEQMYDSLLWHRVIPQFMVT